MVKVVTQLPDDDLKALVAYLSYLEWPERQLKKGSGPGATGK